MGKVLQVDNTLWCEPRKGAVAFHRCRKNQQSGECSCADGVKARDEWAAMQDEVLNSPGRPVLEGVKVGEKRTCEHCGKQNIPAKWAPEKVLCIRCKRDENQRNARDPIDGRKGPVVILNPTFPVTPPPEFVPVRRFCGSGDADSISTAVQDTVDCGSALEDVGLEVEYEFEVLIKIKPVPMDLEKK